MKKELLRSSDFGKLAGMTKRALRYYKEKGILNPEYVNEEGYCFYSEKNLFEARQISTLRYLEFSLEQIKEIQEHKMNVNQSLQYQKRLLTEKRMELDLLIEAIDKMENAVEHETEIDWENMAEIVNFSKRASIENSMRDYYNERAEEYDAIFEGGGPASCNPEVYKKDIKLLFDFLQRFCGESCLDIGCGTAFWLQQYYKNFKRYEFIDVAPNMLEQCKHRVEALQISERSYYILGDFLTKEFDQKKCFDGIIAGFVLGHFTLVQEKKFFSQLHKILKKRGQLVIIDNIWSKWRAKDEVKEDIEKRKLMDGREFSIYKKYFTEEEIIEIFTKYGFEVKEFCLGQNFFGIRGELK